MQYPDWIVTVTFYTAVHAVETLLASDKATATSHDERNGILIRTNRYQHIWKHYKQLYDLGRTVRYLANPERWTPIDVIQPKVIQGLLYPIEASVLKLAKLELELPAISLYPAGK